MNNIAHHIVVFIKKLTLLCCIILSGCTQNKDDDVVHVLVVANRPPFAYFAPMGDGQKLIGFEVELVKIIMENMGKTVQFHEIDSSSLQFRLNNSVNYLAVGALPHGKLELEYSTPYYSAGVGVLKNRYSTLDCIHSFKGTLGVVVGNFDLTSQTIQLAHPEMKIVRYDSTEDAVQELLSAKLDSFLIEASQGKAWEKHHKWKMFFSSLQYDAKVHYAIAFARFFPYKDEVKAIIQNLAQLGVIDELCTKWFVTKIPDLTQAVDVIPE